MLNGKGRGDVRKNLVAERGLEGSILG
jgi:hypothetical protein